MQQISPKSMEWRAICPYGRWVCQDGREVLFNRKYQPILERRPGSPVQPADPTEWVSGWKVQEHFFNDGSRGPQVLGAVNAVLKSWAYPRSSAYRRLRRIRRAGRRRRW
jgi:hypothetical protein